MNRRTKDEEELLRIADGLLRAGEGALDQEASLPQDDPPGLLETSALGGQLFESLLEDTFLPAEQSREEVLRVGLGELGIRVEEEIGRGGMGVIYRAVDENLQREVAVKTIASSSAWRTEDRSRFRREALLLSQLDHPNICQVFRLIRGSDLTQAGAPAEETRSVPDLLVLELVRGETLATVSAVDLSSDIRLRVAEQIAAALASAHQRGVVHRDLKPANVMLREDGVVKVLDFGIARSFDEALPRSLTPEADGEAPAPPAARMSDLVPTVTQTASVVGTPAFMSPEQLRGELPGPATDLWALGVLLHEFFSLGPVWRDDVDLIEQVARGETLPAQGSDRELVALVEELELVDPGARPPATEVAQRLGALRRRPARRRRRLQLALLAAVALAALMLAVVLPLRERQRSNRRVQQVQRVGAQLETIEHELALETLLPPHSLEPVRQRLRTRLDSFLDRLEDESGDPGLTAYALGRGELSLGDAAAAREQLTRAWDLGRREPELASALGRAYASLFREAREGTESIADPGVRAAEVERIERELRDVAVQWLRRGEERDELGRAELQLLEGAPADVLAQLTPERLDPAQRPTAWLLLGRARRALARDARSEEGAAAANLLEEAASDLRRGLTAARSSAELASELCRLEMDLFEVERDRGSGTEATDIRSAQYTQTVATCEEALEIDPGSLANYGLLSGAHRVAAYDLTMSDVEAGLEALQRSKQVIERARPRFDGQARFDLERLLYLSRSVELLQATGQQFEHELDELIELGASLLDRLPGNAQAIVALGFGQWTQAFDLFVGGQDSRAAFASALGTLEQALVLAPDSPNLVNLVGTAQGMLGLSMLERGEDPRQRLAACIASFEHALELYPGNPFPRANLGMAYRDLADYAVLLGEDPAPHLPLGYETLLRALELREDYASAWLTQAELDLAEGRYSLEVLERATAGAQRDAARERAGTAFARAKAAVLRGRELNPQVYAGSLRHAEALLGEVEVWLAHRGLAEARGVEVQQSLGEAERLLRAQIDGGSASERTYAALAKAHRVRSRHAPEAEAEALLEQAEEQLAAAGDAGRGEFYLEVARVALARARFDQTRRAEFRSKARAALHRAVEFNANLARLAALIEEQSY